MTDNPNPNPNHGTLLLSYDVVHVLHMKIGHPASESLSFALSFWSALRP